jgi:FkbM family methyltransferase
MSIKKLIAHGFSKIGIVIFPEWRVDEFLITRRLKRIISEYQIDCIVDVGANVGQYASMLREGVGYEGLIISFEPDPNNVAQLKEASASDDKWLIDGSALGKEEGKLELNVMENSVFNSFLEPDHSGTAQFKDGNSIRNKVEVDVRRLDQVLPELQKTYGFKRVFLKIDTQGFDMDVFEGSTDCIDMIVGIQSEVSFVPIYKDMPKFEDTHKVFKSKGFEISGLYAISESRFPHAIEFDCIYLI